MEELRRILHKQQYGLFVEKSSDAQAMTISRCCCPSRSMAAQASQREVQELRQDNEWLNEKLDEAAAQVQVGPA